MAQHRLRVHAVGVERLGAVAGTGSGSRTVTVPGGSPPAMASIEHEEVVALEQLEGEVHAADAVVLDPDVRWGTGAPTQPLGHLARRSRRRG